MIGMDMLGSSGLVHPGLGVGMGMAAASSAAAAAALGADIGGLESLVNNNAASSSPSSAIPSSSAADNGGGGLHHHYHHHNPYSTAAYHQHHQHQMAAAAATAAHHHHQQQLHHGAVNSYHSAHTGVGVSAGGQIGGHAITGHPSLQHHPPNQPLPPHRPFTPPSAAATVLGHHLHSTSGSTSIDSTGGGGNMGAPSYSPNSTTTHLPTSTVKIKAGRGEMFCPIGIEITNRGENISGVEFLGKICQNRGDKLPLAVSLFCLPSNKNSRAMFD